MKRSSPTLGFLTLLIFLFLYLPIGVVVVYSFNASKFSAAWQGFTTNWYAALWRDGTALSALKNTLLLGIFSTLIATLLGTLLGYGLKRHAFPAKPLVTRLLYVPVCVPDIVMAVALLLFYSLLRQWTGWFQLGLGTMILSHVTFQIPFVAMVVRARMEGLDPSLEEAAYDLGASRWQRLMHITLPLMSPGILAGALLAFTLSLDDFVVSFFTAGPGSTTLPILIYSSVKRGITPEIHALSTLIIVASVAGTVAAIGLQRKNSRT